MYSRYTRSSVLARKPLEENPEDKTFENCSNRSLPLIDRSSKSTGGPPGNSKASRMNNSIRFSLVFLFLLTCLAPSWSQQALDSMVTGNYTSSDGSRISITPFPGDTSEKVMVSINGQKAVPAVLKEDRHNTVAIYFGLSDGTPISGHYFASENLFRLTDQGEMWATWRRSK